MSTSIDWTELIKDRKGVITKDNQACGNIIGEDDENIIIEDGAVRQHFYRVPKSAAGAYNGAELTLNISYDELKTYEEKDKDKGIVESVTGTIKDKTKSLKDKTVDKLDDDDEEYQQQIKETRDNQDIQTSTNTNTLNRENRNELNQQILAIRLFRLNRNLFV